MSSGDGLVLLGNKPLPEPMLTPLCHHMMSPGRNELDSVLTLNISIEIHLYYHLHISFVQ